jgi:hypothetical protein
MEIGLQLKHGVANVIDVIVKMASNGTFFCRTF